MSHQFQVRKKGSKRFVDLFAINRQQAAMNLARIQESKKFLVRDPQLKPGSLEKSRIISRGNVCPVCKRITCLCR